jgi:hypothetical protein
MLLQTHCCICNKPHIVLYVPRMMSVFTAAGTPYIRHMMFVYVSPDRFEWR